MRSGEGPPLRILIVDDMPDLRFLYALVLRRSGRFQVVGEAEDGEQAIDQARRLQPDLVLLDLAMPRVDGLEALPGIRAAAPRARVVVLSGFDEARLRHEAAARGAVGYLEKGLAHAELVERLKELADRPIQDRSPDAGPVPLGRPNPARVGTPD